MKKLDVFISRKSADAPFAKKIYDYLTAQGLSVFESNQSLKELGNADYIKSIDEALANTTHMIVVASSEANIKSSWVEAEWLFFLNRKRSGKTSGNLFTVITKDMNLNEVPPSLANYEVIPYNEKNFPIIYNYCRQENTPAKPAPKNPFPAERQNKYLWVVIGILLVGMLSATIYFSSQPYDATFFLKPNPIIKLQADYPAPVFKEGELSVFIGNKEERKQILDQGEVNFKQLIASSKGEKAAVQLHLKYWKSELDTVPLDKTIHLNLIPDGSLSLIYGNVKTKNGLPIPNAHVSVGIGIGCVTDPSGYFKMELPFGLQKEYYNLSVTKEGFKPYMAEYRPVSGNIDIRME